MDENDDYRIVDARTIPDLKARVSKLMQYGWKCQGGPYQSAATPQHAAEWHQAMIRQPNPAETKLRG